MNFYLNIQKNPLINKRLSKTIYLCIYVRVMRKIILNEEQIRIITEKMVKSVLNEEISAADAYRKFYSTKFSEQEFSSLMNGSRTMTPLHKHALDIMSFTGWNQELCDLVQKVWNMGNDARAYAIEMCPKNKVTKEDAEYQKTLLERILTNTLGMKGHTEAQFADNGLYKVNETDDVLITCTTSYSASKKYYGTSHWCTASDIGGKYNGFEMFCKYTGLDEDYSISEDYAILVQFVNKKDNEKTFQLAVYDNGDPDEACWFSGKRMGSPDIDAMVKGYGFNSVEEALGGVENIRMLLDKTSEDMNQEWAYWSKKSEELCEKRKTDVVNKINSGSYTVTLLTIFEKMEKRDSNELFSEDIGVEYPAIEVVRYPLRPVSDRSIRLYNIAFLGFNDEERNWLNGLYEADNAAVLDGFNNMVAIVRMEDGEPETIEKINGMHVSRMMQNVAILEKGDMDYGYEYGGEDDGTMLIDARTGRVIAKNAEMVCNLAGGLYSDYIEGHDILYIWETERKTSKFRISAIDAYTAKYIGPVDNSKINPELIMGGRRLTNDKEPNLYYSAPVRESKRIILTQEQTRVLVEEMVKGKMLINEISTKDAYNRFYADKIPEDKYAFIMNGTESMTPLHKAVLDCVVWLLTQPNDERAEQIVDCLHSTWERGNDARAYAIEHMPTKKQAGTLDRLTNQLILFLQTVSRMSGHTEMQFADNGFCKLYENDKALITCTTTYSASKKYYGKSHWCTASGLDGELNGWKMFMQYTGTEDDDGYGDGPAILVQVVDKTNNEQTFQAQVFNEDCSTGDVCWFNGKSVVDDSLLEQLRHLGLAGEEVATNEYGDEMPFNGVIEAIGGEEAVDRLYKETENGVAQEYEYWHKKSQEMFRKRATEILETEKNGYDDFVLNVIREKGPNFGSYRVDYYKAEWNGPFFEMTNEGVRNGIMLATFVFDGTNRVDRQWVSGHIDEGSLPEEFGQEIWFIDVSGEPRIISKYMGTLSGNYNNNLFSETDVVMAYLYNSMDDILRFKDSTTLLEVSTGKVLLNNFEPVEHISSRQPITMEINGNLSLLVLERDKKSSVIYIAAFDLINKKYLGRINTDNLDTKMFCGNAGMVKGNGLKR